MKLKIAAKFKITLALFACCLLLFGTSANAQNAKKLLKKANQYYGAFDYKNAIPLYRDVLLVDNSLEAKQKLANCYRFTHDYEKAEYWYKQLVILAPEEPVYQLFYAQSLQSNGNCEDAKRWFLKYAKYDVLGEKLAKGCEGNASFAKKQPKYDVWLLPLNSEGTDFSPQYFERGIVFCSDRDDVSAKSWNKGRNERPFIDLYYAERQLGNSFTNPTKIKGKVNSKYNEGPACFTPDGESMVFTRNAYLNGKRKKSKSGVVKLNLFLADMGTGYKWARIREFEHNNPEYSMAHPSISRDGQSLYFASNMPGGLGGTDIYVCTRIDTFWSQPLNLGPEVNTPGDEMFPYVHQDGTLYFASNGHAGLGGLDVFSSKRLPDGGRANPKNMGKPINSEKDDFGLIIDRNKQTGYFSSNRDGGFGSDDIYRFTAIGIAKDDAPPPITTIEQPAVQSVLLNPNIGLNKVTFAPGSWELSPLVTVELDKIADYLYQNPEMAKVEIAAHTDSRGDDFINLEISSKRAKAIKNYLIDQGIDGKRLIAKGYGEQNILNHCYNGMACDEQFHQVNNRVEVKALKIKSDDHTPAPAPIVDHYPKPKIKARGKNKSNKIEKKKERESTVDENADLTPTPVLRPEPREELPDPQPSFPSTKANDDVPNYNYKVYVGPFRNVSNDVYNQYTGLTTSIDLEYSPKGMMLVLGPFDTIKRAENIATLAKSKGAKKPYIMVYDGRKPTNLSIKKLKRQGWK